MKDNTTTVSFPDGISIEVLLEKYELARTEYAGIFRRMRKLDMLDNNELWKTLQAKYPSYQLLPETNHVNWTKCNILAAIYCVGRAASLLPTSEEDKDTIERINVALENIWDTLDVPYYQMLAGERAALFNLGVTQVGWDSDIIMGTKDSFFTGRVKLKNINPMRYMRDPFADDLDSSDFVITWDDYPESLIRNNPNYKERFIELKRLSKLGNTTQDTETNSRDTTNDTPAGRRGYHRIVKYWIKRNSSIYEIHLINNAELLYQKEIKPALFPFAELYCNLKGSDVVGLSEPAKIATNSIIYNVMNSLVFTADYKNQRPPRFINNQSMLDVNAFLKHGNDADRTFVVQGDASRAVHYHQFPQPSQTAIMATSRLATDIQSVTGIDDRYTGRDTGSVLTTGGIDSMLNQATMIDAPKINMYEKYSLQLTQLVLMNYIQHGGDRTYLRKTKLPTVSETVRVPFDEIKTKTDDSDIVFNYTIAISPALPKNKQRIEATADKLMQMQMQYKGAGIEVDLITPEEWLELQDLPNKEMMFERMGIQRASNWTEMVAHAVTEYGQLIANGVDSDTAIAATAQTLQAQNQAGTPDLADVAQSVSNMG